MRKTRASRSRGGPGPRSGQRALPRPQNELVRAYRNIGLDPKGGEKSIRERQELARTRADWMIRFTYKDLAALSPRELEQSSLEALIFAKGRVFVLGHQRLPTLSELRQAQSLSRSTLTALRQEGRADFRAPSWQGELWWEAGLTSGRPRTDGLSFLDGFSLQTFEALQTFVFIERKLLFCAKCSKAFISKRAEARTCSPNCRTLMWRDENRQQFREQRKAYYRARVAEQLGKSPEKVVLLRRRERGLDI